MADQIGAGSIYPVPGIFPEATVAAMELALRYADGTVLSFVPVRLRSLMFAKVMF